MSQTLYRDPPLEASDRAELARRLLLGAYDQPWRARAACRDHPGELFTDIGREAEARPICAACPVREECLDHALAVGETSNVWGGLTEVERRRLRPGRVPRICSWCLELFEVERKPGRAPTTCSPECYEAAREANRFEWERRNRPGVGTLLERGHGTLHRAHTCSCPACRKAKRLARAEQRRKNRAGA